jgi:hypothetical protein
VSTNQKKAITWSPSYLTAIWVPLTKKRSFQPFKVRPSSRDSHVVAVSRYNGHADWLLIRVKPLQRGKYQLCFSAVGTGDSWRDQFESDKMYLAYIRVCGHCVLLSWFGENTSPLSRTGFLTSPPLALFESVTKQVLEFSLHH